MIKKKEAKKNKKVKISPSLQKKLLVLKKEADNLKMKNNLKSIKAGEQFVWTSKMSVHEETIDKQHQSLLGELNELIKEAAMGEEMDKLRNTMHFLDNYALEHFNYEEDYMKTLGYPGLKEHQLQHKGFIKFYGGLKKEFGKIYKPRDMKREDLQKLIDKIRKFLGDWLVNHINKMDHKYAEFAEKKSNNKQKIKNSKFDMASIKAEIDEELKGGKIEKHEAEIKEQRASVLHVVNNLKEKDRKIEKERIATGIPGFDKLFEKGIPRGCSVLVAGGAGSGKTIFCLQTLINKANQGKKCYYMSFEESEDRLIEHMEEFGWNPRELIKKGKLVIKRMNPFDITRNVDALLAKQKGELLIDIDPVIMPEDFKPDFVAIDSLTAIASAFTGKEDSYRIYIEQLFRFFEKLGSTNFLITETEQIPKIFSQTGVEEFLADGVIVFYNFKRGDVREKGIEVLKMRGENHQKKIVAVTISSGGITVYPDQEVFSEM
jgi:hemerythrin-like metal-binding protein